MRQRAKPETVDKFVRDFLSKTKLSEPDLVEAVSIARGLSAQASADFQAVTFEAVRSRRKRLYQKLGVTGSDELTAKLLQAAVEGFAS